MSEHVTEDTPEKSLPFANLLLSGGAAMCLIVWLYFIYYYSWTQQRYFTSQFGVILYYVCPLILFVLLVASLRLRRAYKNNIVLSIFSVVISIYAVELFLLGSDIIRILNETGEFTVYESDEHGFHNPQGVW
ncbi:MAG: hypothetical protein ACREOH_00915, partial [Candidatus Entotheonellia bacterium]